MIDDFCYWLELIFFNSFFGSQNNGCSAIIDFTPFAMAVAIVLHKLTKKKIYLYAIVLFFLVPAITSVRTGLVGLGVSLLAISFFKYKLRALPVFIIIISGFVGSVLFIPNVRDKMFKGAFNSAEEVL